MTDPAPDSRPQRPGARPQRGPTVPDGPPEEEGPLRLQRFRKPDGRALLLFKRRDDV